MVKSTSCLQWHGKKYVGTCSQPWRARSNFSAVDPRSEESTVLQQHFKLATLPFAWSRDLRIAHHVRRCRRSSVWSAGPAWVYSGWTGWRSPSSGPFHFSWHAPSMQIVSEKDCEVKNLNHLSITFCQSFYRELCLLWQVCASPWTPHAK